MEKKIKNAFSLVELLIVVIIIGVVYTLSVGGLQKLNNKDKKIVLENLKEYLQTFEYDENIKLVCLDDCSFCEVFADGKKVKEIDGFLDQSVKVYRYDFSLGMIEKEEDDVCFSYTIDKKGVESQVFVEFKEAVYDFSTYLSPVSVYDSLQEAEDAKQRAIQEIMR